MRSLLLHIERIHMIHIQIKYTCWKIKDSLKLYMRIVKFICIIKIKGFLKYNKNKSYEILFLLNYHLKNKQIFYKKF